MNTDNSPGRTARRPDAGDAVPNAAILAAEKKPSGVAGGNTEDADANGLDPFAALLASQSKRDKEKKRATGLALAPAIEPHDPGPREDLLASQSNKSAREKKRELEKGMEPKGDNKERK